MSNSNLLLAIRAALLLGTVAASGTATAQQAASGKEESLLQEIVVTADRMNSFGADLVQAGTFRGAEVIDTPLSINILPRDLLEAQQAESIHDAMRNTAGVTFAQIGGAIYSNLAIRGITVENRGNYRMNGALPIVNLIALPLENKERIEVLKGVSALYYGFTTPSGIVNLTTKRPTAEPLVDVTLLGNDHGGWGGHIDAGGRFMDGKAGARVNLAYGDLDIGVDNTNGHRSMGSLSADFDPTETLSFRLDYEYINKSITEPATWLAPNAVAGVTSVPPVPDPKQNLGGEWQYGDGWETNVLGQMTWRFARDWELNLYAGRSKLDRDRRFSQFQNYNLTTGAGTLAIQLTNGNILENNNYRGEIAGAFMTGPVKHEVIVGYTQNKRDQEIPSNPFVNLPQNFLNPIAIPNTPLPPRIVFREPNIKDEGTYVFDRMTFGEGQWLQVLAGWRNTDYESVDTRYSTTGAVTSRLVYTADEGSPAVGVVIKPKEWLSLYGTYIEGLEEGGVAPATAVNSGEVMPPGVTEQWELGVKAEYEKLLLTLAYFDIDRPSSFENAAKRFVQDGRTTYKGVEFSASGELGSFSVYSTAMWLDATQKNAALTTVIGKRPENTPEFTGSLFVEYRLPMAEGLALSAGVFHVGERPINATNTGFADGYTTFDLGARYNVDIGDTPTTFRLYVENVADEAYWSATGSNLLGVSLPRTIRLSVTARML
jgi:iron complex outermembrane receptor protein